MTLVEQIEENAVSNLSMIRCASGSEYVERDAESVPAVNKLLVVFGHHILWGNGFSLRTNCYRSPVLVAAGNHQHLVALKTMISRKNIGRQVSASDMP